MGESRSASQRMPENCRYFFFAFSLPFGKLACFDPCRLVRQVKQFGKLNPAPFLSPLRPEPGGKRRSIACLLARVTILPAVRLTPQHFARRLIIDPPSLIRKNHQNKFDNANGRN